MVMVLKWVAHWQPIHVLPKLHSQVRLQVGQLIMQYATENIIPVTLELGGKSPNIFFEDVMAQDDDYLDKALEGFAMFAP